MQGLLALIPLVLQVLPKLAPIFGTPLSGGILDKAGQVAKEVFGTVDAAQIQLQIDQEKKQAGGIQVSASTPPPRRSKPTSPMYSLRGRRRWLWRRSARRSPMALRSCREWSPSGLSWC